MTPEDYANSRVVELIGEYIHNARDRDILRDNLIDGLSYGELAGKYHLSYERIKTIIRKGKITVFRHY